MTAPITHTKREISYVELRNRVANLAGALRAKGVEKGDRVIIYMPMIPEGAGSDAGLRASGGGAFGRLRRVCRQ